MTMWLPSPLKNMRVRSESRWRVARRRRKKKIRGETRCWYPSTRSGLKFQEQLWLEWGCSLVECWLSKTLVYRLRTVSQVIVYQKRHRSVIYRPE